ncbi:RDD family protein [Haloarculaceae archaeon H-GB2-1]|nr:RDD family protein [Haloarculaceae archaeon H-GB1-1]MEA5386052.1 RDD family protein [Haloarculaceae archaeon H-GB11]MEA5407560.1 RDD family protein [Haloarculaceae archaeon H-GB2-1]
MSLPDSLDLFGVIHADRAGKVTDELVPVSDEADAVGCSPSTTACLVRNMLRPVDGLFFYGVGFVVAQVSDRRQRIGDVLAGTVVMQTDTGGETAENTDESVNDVTIATDAERRDSASS